MPITINGTTGIAGVDGSAATPSVQGADANTGVFFPAADTVALTTGGSERMRVDSSGNVGIGTSSPSYRVDVASADTTAGTGYAVRIRANATAAAGAIQFTDSTAATQNGIIAVDTSSNMKFTTSLTERFRIASAGQIGIGGANYGTSGQVLTSGGASAAPSWASVGTATAGLAYGDVGSYGFFMWSSAAQQSPGTTVAGSSLLPANAFTQSGTAGYATVFGQPSGTWRLMGQTGYNNGTVVLSRNDQYISVFLRIS